MHSVEQMFDQHHSNPEEVVAALRSYPIAKKEEMPKFAFLVVHLIGESLGEWKEAYALLQKMQGDHSSAGVLVNLAICARLGGDAEAASRYGQQLCAELACTPAQTESFLALRLVQHTAKAMTQAAIAGAIMTSAAVLAPARLPEKLLPLCASVYNNVVSLLLDDPEADLKARPWPRPS